MGCRERRASSQPTLEIPDFISEHANPRKQKENADQGWFADGSRYIVNGTFDWVYEEELFCRDGFRWSPDGKQIAK